MSIGHETFGVELEKPFTRLDGESHSVSADYFQTLQTLKGERGEETHLKKLGSAIIGIETPYGEESLDNGFNLGESATGPVGSLAELWSIVRTEIGDVINALEQEGAGILNMANHPLTYVNESTYQRNAAPKPIYPYLREYRRWHHEAGIDAKAQNSPSVGVPFERAAEAVNAIIGFGAAFIGIYANSPFLKGASRPVAKKADSKYGLACSLIPDLKATKELHARQNDLLPICGITFSGCSALILLCTLWSKVATKAAAK